MEYIWSILLSIVLGFVAVFYLFRNFNFFKRNGIIHLSPIPILGSLTLLTFRLESLVDFILKMYNYEPKAKYIGFYSMTMPIFYFRDPELIKEALVKNFEAFPNRRGFGEIREPLFAKNLFSLKGQKWRDVRSLLSPAFTSSKMKAMFILMSECAMNFADSLARLSMDKNDMDMKDAFTKYTNDVIATCAFGIKIDSMKDPTNKFYVYGKEATNFTGLRGVKFLIMNAFPRFANFIHLKLFSDHVIDFFKDIVKNTIATRDAENIIRPDMLQLMMEKRGSERELNIDDMTAQAFIFFFGGFDTSSTAMSFAAHEIAANPDVQAKLQQEVDHLLTESNGDVTYEAINKLEYLEAVISETLRLYPPVTALERICDTTFELPPTLPGEKSFVMKKGMFAWIPVYSIHHDKKYYDEPEKFRPERFLGDKTYHNWPHYMPFGVGPRMCIANRFALLELKVLLFHLLARCELKPCAKTTLPMKFSKNLTLMPEGGFWINVRPRSDAQSTVRSTTANNSVDS